MMLNASQALRHDSEEDGVVFPDATLVDRPFEE